MTKPRHIAVIGAGIAGIACARTLVQAGHRTSVFEKSAGLGGRMATRSSPFGGFDHGAQYFTVRDPRFSLALQTAPAVCKPWSASTVRVLDDHGGIAAAGLPAREAHWVPTPGMAALAAHWAQPLRDAGSLEGETRVTRIERTSRGAGRWQLHTVGPETTDGHRRQVFRGFDEVLLAIPAWQARELLQNSELADDMAIEIDKVQVAPCWALMLAFPQAMQPGLNTLGPQWNAARSTHHRIAWLARESSKPGRDPIERWTVHASAAWSREHFDDQPDRVQAKLRKAFSEVTGIRAEPAHAQVHRWAYAQTVQPLGRSHLWDPSQGIGACGDWCVGHRVEDAFVSGLELALAVA
ncbi:MAG: amine oxidase [Betaproteobacteria bacterium]|jgi:renalase|nr:amine oxidase [Betaproteobacteria bacterium]